MLKLFGNLIDNIYDVGRIYRIMNTINKKSGLYKIPLTHAEFRNLSLPEIRELAQNPRSMRIIDEDWMESNGELEGYVEDVEIETNNVKPHSQNAERAAVCITNIWNDNSVSERNNTGMRVVSHYQRSGIPEDAAIELMIIWGGRVGIGAKECTRIVQQVYKNNYKYSCNDNILKSYCSSDCIFYKNQNYGANNMALQLLSAHQMRSELVNYIEQDFTGRQIDLANIFGFSNKDWKLVPGNVCVIMAPTGGGKSAFAQQITTISGVNTIYASLEVSPIQMYRRSIQQVTGMSKTKVEQSLLQGDTSYMRHIEHVHYVQSYSLDLKEIHELIRNFEGQFTVLVVDHIKLIGSGSGDDYTRLGEITRQLKMLALKYKIIIIEISQVSNSVARTGTWDAVSGSGNGSIGHDADMVLALIGNNTEPAREVRCLKNRDGDQGISFEGYLDNCFRFVRKEYERTLEMAF